MLRARMPVPRLPNRRLLGGMAIVWSVIALPSCPTSGDAAEVLSARARSDLTAARRLFEANLDAIRRRDRDAYLACYLQSGSLARTGPAGFLLGYDSLAASAGRGWPDHFEALDLRLVPVQPGVVYGTYRYRVRYGDVEQAGLSERVFVDTPQGWRIAVTSAFPSPAGQAPAPRALVGATLLDGTGAAPVRNAVVVIRDGKIECAGPASRCRAPEGVDTLDVRGHWITPGLVDAHVHYSQTGWADGRPDALDLRDRFPYEETQERLRSTPGAFHRAYLCSGVTSVFDVGGYPWTVAMQRVAENDPFAPRVAAAGPLLSTYDFWLNLPAERQFMYLAGDSAARAGVRYLKSLGAAAVKVWFIMTPGRDFETMERAVAAAGDEARKVALPLIVHATGLREAKAALRAGARLLVHSVWDRRVDQEFLRLAKRAGTIYCPTLTVLEGYQRLFDSVRNGQPPAVDDPNGCVDSLTRARVAGTGEVGISRLGSRRPTDPAMLEERRRVMAANLLAVHRAGIPIAMGTDAGNPLTLHGPADYAEMDAMRAAGMPAMAVLVAATRGGARAMGRSDIGTIAPGQAADLLVLAADPLRDVRHFRRLRYVVKGGVVRGIEELAARSRP
jgi:imidazolonepropionase-like amidohydrolase